MLLDHGIAARCTEVSFQLAAAGADGIKDLLPNSATSSSAREALNERTSNLPSFTDVGDSLKNALGGTSDPKDIGRAINQNTPGAHRLLVNGTGCIFGELFPFLVCRSMLWCWSAGMTRAFRRDADGPDLTKNPKDLAQDAKQGAKDLVRSPRPAMHPLNLL